MAEPGKDDQATSMAYGICLGVAIGSIVSAFTGEWWLVGVGISLGVALGLGVDLSNLFGSDDSDD